MGLSPIIGAEGGELLDLSFMSLVPRKERSLLAIPGRVVPDGNIK
jgi:hypothetical protein